MLNELMEAIGYDNMLKTIKDLVDTSNSLYIKIPIDRLIEDKDFVVVGKEPKVDQLEQLKWFKARECLNKYIAPNKAIVQGTKYKYPKMVSSTHENCIIFNWDNFLKHKNTTKDINLSLQNLISEFLSTLDKKDFLEYYTKNIDNIVQFINKNELNKIMLKIFIDVEEEKCERDYAEYLKSKLFDNDTIHKINDKTYGRLSQFYTMNSKKPYLSHMLKITDEIHLVDEKEVLNTFYLKQYMDVVKFQKIDYGIGNIVFDMEFNSSTKKYYINFYKNNPYKVIDDLRDNIYIENVTSNKKSKEKVITKYSELSKYILQLTDFKIKGYYSEKDSTEGRFKTFATMYFKHLKDLNNSNFNTFKSIYKSMMKNMLKLYIYDEDTYKIINIINFDVCMTDYLFKSNLKEEIKGMMDKIRNKIVKNEKVYVIENDMEFYILCGQLAKFLKSKTKTDKITNRLFYEYNMATRTKRLVDILQRDKEKLDYNNNNSSRSGRILSAINIYYTENEKTLKKIDKIRFNIGLYYGENLLYATNKKDENKKGEN
ncbi:hypothetical protein K144316041_p21320 (plasmid) [Clostridium tetani]|uniref:hypothetical protein n=1 Tax=Clostridium tetani TaxID=1513 RepID=UPI002955D31A|nr:hypothetical protein [Clostridium tetani]BDR74293.1 hypothetical protein K144316041_p21320 [Clostridium tetani]